MQQEDQTHRTQVLTCLNLWSQITWTIISNHGCESPANASSKDIKHKINLLQSLNDLIFLARSIENTLVSLPWALQSWSQQHHKIGLELTSIHFVLLTL